MGAMVRCEYCGQLFDGLSCPHCCAPRNDDSDVDIFYVDGVPYWRSDVGFIDCDGNPVDSLDDHEVTGEFIYVSGDTHDIIDPWADEPISKVDMNSDPESDSGSIEYFFVDVDPYKNEHIGKNEYIDGDENSYASENEGYFESYATLFKSMFLAVLIVASVLLFFFIWTI